MLTLAMHPATDGDCLVMTYGDETRTSSLVVDLGRGSTWAAVRDTISALNDIELFAITHVDSDHIAGAVPMVREDKPPFEPRRVWFNALQQLQQAADRSKFEAFSPAEGEKLSQGIFRFHWPRNAEFASRVVSTDSPEAHDWMDMGAGLRLLLISPDDKSLARMLPVWEHELEIAKISPFDPDDEEKPGEDKFEEFGGAPDVPALAATPFEPDHKEANCTSIAFVAEFAGKRIMLAGDANSEVIEQRLAPFAEAEGGRFKVDLLKVSHHGSRKNTSPKLFKMLDCQKFAFSTDGSRNHGHPHPETIARILANDPARPKMFYFNYDGPHAKIWKSQMLQGQWNYRAIFPDTAHPGMLEISL